MRSEFASGGDAGAAHLLWLAEASHYATMRMKAAQKSRVRDLLDEADLFPHNLYSESARTLHAHLTCAILQGVIGAKLWLTAFDDELPESGEEPYEAIFSAHQGFYDELHRRVSAGVHWWGALPPLPDGHMLWTVVNCNIDPLRPRVRCRRPVRGIELLTPGGRREALPFHVCGTAVVPEVELALHEPGIFRFND